MFRHITPLGGILAVLLLLSAALYAYRETRLAADLTTDNYPVLTPISGAAGFEPKSLPAGPVLRNLSIRALKIAFGYKSGAIPYSYTLDLDRPGPDDTSHATLSARRSPRNVSMETPVVWRWDEPRKAYAVALQGKFDVQPPVPALCIKAVVGPQTKSYDLRDGSLCVAQRDATGSCRPETLACGLIR